MVPEMLWLPRCLRNALRPDLGGLCDTALLQVLCMVLAIKSGPWPRPLRSAWEVPAAQMTDKSQDVQSPVKSSVTADWFKLGNPSTQEVEA